MSQLPEALLAYATVFPSGERLGVISSPGALVSCVKLAPASENASPGERTDIQYKMKARANTAVPTTALQRAGVTAGARSARAAARIRWRSDSRSAAV